MKNTSRFITAFLFIACSSLAFSAEHMGEEQKEVWQVVANSWADDVAENGKWPGEYIHEDAHSWGPTWPMPRNAESIASWSRFNAESGDTVKYELFPITINVVDGTAVAYYGMVTVATDYQGKRERSSRGLIETLVRTDAGWKFIGLTSFEMGDD